MICDVGRCERVEMVEGVRSPFQMIKDCILGESNKMRWDG